MLKRNSKEKVELYLSICCATRVRVARVPLDVNVRACAKVKCNMRFFRWSASYILLSYDSVSTLIVVSKVFPRLF